MLAGMAEIEFVSKNIMLLAIQSTANKVLSSSLPLSSSTLLPSFFDKKGAKNFGLLETKIFFQLGGKLEGRGRSIVSVWEKWS